MIPRFLRPSRFVRRWVMRRGLQSSNNALRFLALVYIGRTPFLRTKAMRDGVYGRQRAWQAVAAGFLVADIVGTLTSKEAEVVSVESLKVGESVKITALGPRGRWKRSA